MAGSPSNAVMAKHPEGAYVRWAEITALQEQNENLKSIVRSAHSIADRRGVQTNWVAFKKQCMESLKGEEKR